MGLKYWGDKTSTDLVYFEDHGIALYPDQPYNLLGIYSGTAFVEGGRVHYFLYGEYVLLSRCYPEPDQDKIRFNGKASLTIRKWDLTK